jgi:penicillin-binding protein 1A
MNRALKDVPMLLPQPPEGLVAFGEGKERTYIYAENVKERAPDEEGQDAIPLPKPDLSAPPSD